MAIDEKISRSILFEDYEAAILPTDFMPPEIRPILLGIFGEVGSVMAPAKKLHREKEAYKGYRHAVEEEFGDVLWYLTALIRRLKKSTLSDLMSEAVKKGDYKRSVAASDIPDGAVIHISSGKEQKELDDALLDLGIAAADLLILKDNLDSVHDLLIIFIQKYLQALEASKITFSRVAHLNIIKTQGRFVEPDYLSLPTFDSEFEEDERLPDYFEITITQKKSGQSYMKWNGVIIGAPLTDNILDPDDYRFHDVFHFAHAAILHWSPTFRALIKHKRKSDRVIDEAQDGGRAIVVEEGLTAWLFARAKELNFFEGHQGGVSFDLLKTIHQFVQGYEVEQCPLKLWERAILQGFDVFRQIRAHKGGVIIADRGTRTITFRPLPL